MRSGLGTTRRVGRMLAALLALAGLARTPLPQPDFHNIRHHDSPGEICEHHDHLLRWHPSAGSASDVSVLHWHWFLLRSDGGDPVPEGSGQALHAHAPDVLATISSDVGLVVPDTSPRLVGTRDFSASSNGELLAPDAGKHAPSHSWRVPNAPGATLARGPALIVLQQRWLC